MLGAVAVPEVLQQPELAPEVIGVQIILGQVLLERVAKRTTWGSPWGTLGGTYGSNAETAVLVPSPGSVSDQVEGLSTVGLSDLS